MWNAHCINKYWPFSFFLSRSTGLQLYSGIHGDFTQHWSCYFVCPFFYLNSALPASIPLVQLHYYQINTSVITTDLVPARFLNKLPVYFYWSYSTSIRGLWKATTQNWPQQLCLLFCLQRARFDFLISFWIWNGYKHPFWTSSFNLCIHSLNAVINWYTCFSFFISYSLLAFFLTMLVDFFGFRLVCIWVLHSFERWLWWGRVCKVA